MGYPLLPTPQSPFMPLGYQNPPMPGYSFSSVFISMPTISHPPQPQLFPPYSAPFGQPPRMIFESQSNNFNNGSPNNFYGQPRNVH